VRKAAKKASTARAAMKSAPSKKPELLAGTPGARSQIAGLSSSAWNLLYQALRPALAR
jgi:hypothetical protein